ncbi:hypothetical protein [Aquimarina longa]|uniref:hypothetical protein n=1 Tax=Aquimarina longa TaxID=1080221 RepID=UPI0007803A6C|nr:hypothetical protein [Aquimarina longa]
MKYPNIVLIIFLAFNLSSCYSQKKPFEEGITQLLESIYENDSISEISLRTTNLSNDIIKSEQKKYFHCIVREEGKLINVDIVLINKPAKSFCYSLDIKGLKAFVYSKGCNFNKSQLDAFFRIDSDYWEFIIENSETERFIFYQLKKYPNLSDKTKSDENTFKL